MPERSAIDGHGPDQASVKDGDLTRQRLPWRTRLSRLWPRRRRPGGNRTPTGQFKVLVISSKEGAEAPHVEGLTRTFWADDDMPSLLGFDVVVVEVPDNEELLKALVPEIAQATLAGALVIWLLPSSTGVRLPREVIETRSFSQRKPLSSTATRILDPRFADYLRGVEEVVILFECPPGVQPVAVFGETARLCAAAIDESRFPATVVYLPRSRHPARYATLRAMAERLRTKGDPPRRRRLALLRLVAMTGVLALAVTAARYAQRHANRSLREFKSYQAGSADTWFRHDRSEGVGELSPDQWAKLDDLDRSTKTLDALVADMDAVPLLRVLDSLGMTQQADAVIARASSPPASACDSSPHAVYLRTTVEEAVARGDFEGGRYAAQRLLNFVTGLPPCDYFGVANDDLAVAHAVVQLADGNYLYHDREVAAALATHALRWTDYGKPVALPATWDPSLEDDVAYYTTLRATRGLSEAPAIELWRRFVAASPGATRAVEGSFNVILEQLWRHEDTDSRDAVVRQNTAGIALCREFVNRHPDSYLADDAERLRLRMAVTIDDFSQVRDAFAVLATRYETGDRWKGLAAQLQGAIARRQKDDRTNQAVWRRLVDWITTPSQVPLAMAIDGLGGDERTLMLDLFSDYVKTAARTRATPTTRTWDASVRLMIHLAREG